MRSGSWRTRAATSRSTDFWRFWVVHLWVEDFLELFTTVMVAYFFVLLGVVEERIALRLIYLDIILYSVGGVVGTMHHLYFSGEPVEHMALGAFFSAAEVIPLTFLTLEAWTFLRIGAGQEASATHPFPHRWAMMFLVAVGFWNFVGAGIFGFLINLPIVSYYEIGTALTANHGHASMMGVYGMLAAGLSLFGLRYLIPEERWSERAAQALVLVAQPRPRLDGVRRAVPARRSSALRVRESRLLRGARAQFPDGPDEPRPRVAAPARRRSSSSSAALCHSSGSAGSASGIGDRERSSPARAEGHSSRSQRETTP